jgi:hypothetical protein
MLSCHHYTTNVVDCVVQRSNHHAVLSLATTATIGRTRYYTRVHMAILCVRDTSALDAADRSALTAWRDLLFMDPFALCLSRSRYVCTIRAMLWLVYV